VAVSAPLPFTYPRAVLARRHGPGGYEDYRSYRPWLRDEYTFRCVFCLIRERWGQATGQFDLDHFVPHAQHPGQSPEYENLIYTCHSCNLRKSDNEMPQADLSSENVRIYEDGRMVGLTPHADKMIRLLWLNSPQSIEWRRLWIRIVKLAKEHDGGLFSQLMGYPDDLPDLSKLNPPSNSKPEGIEQCYHELHQRGELPSTYLY